MDVVEFDDVRRSEIDEQDTGAGAGAPTRLERLASLVRRRREGLWNPDARKYGVTMENAAAAADMSPVTWRRVEAGKSVRGLSYTGVESVLEWPTGSIRHYLEGGVEPTGPDEVPAEPAPAAPSPSAPTLLDATHDELLAELRRRLRHLEPSAPITEQRPHLAASSVGTETVESVEAQGGRAGLPLESDEGGGDSVAEGGQA